MTPYYADDLVTIYHGDWHDYLPLRADAVISDPPYGIGHASWDIALIQSDLDAFLATTRGVVALFGGAPTHAQAAMLALIPRAERTYIWHNTFTRTHSEGALWQWQPIYVWRRGGLRGLKRDVISLTGFGPGVVHPAQKPIRLMGLLVAATEGTILDPFMGSGTTLVAAKSQCRRAIGIEIDEHYCEIAATRCSQEVLSLSEPMVATTVAQTLRMDLPEHE